MCRKNLEQEYKEMIDLIPNAKMKIFDHGGHPTIATNVEAFFELARQFLKENIVR